MTNKKSNILEWLERNWKYIIILVGFFSAGLFFGRQTCNVCWVQIEQLKEDTASLRNCIRLNCKCNQSIKLDPMVYDFNGNQLKNSEVSGKIIVKGHASGIESFHVYLVLKSVSSHLSYIQPSKNLGFNVSSDFSDTCFLGEGAYTAFDGIKTYAIFAIAVDTTYQENTLYDEKIIRHVKAKSNVIPEIIRIK
jgi:hypothetical protein